MSPNNKNLGIFSTLRQFPATLSFNPGRRYVPALIFLLLGAATAISGWLIFSAMRDAIKHDVQQNLTTIAQLKVEQIENWLHERETDLGLIATDSYVARTLAAWMRSGKPAGNPPLIQAQFDYFHRKKR